MIRIWNKSYKLNNLKKIGIKGKKGILSDCPNVLANGGSMDHPDAPLSQRLTTEI